MEVANTLAYYGTATIMALIKFVIQAPGSKHYDPYCRNGDDRNDGEEKVL